MVKRTDRPGTYNTRVALVVGTCALALLTVAIWASAFKEPTKPIATLAASGVNTMPNVTVCVFNDKGELSIPTSMPKVVRTEEEWKKLLTAEQYYVTRNSGTERAFCGNLLDNHKNGVYTCICCRLPLFASNAKFNSGTGWPSFLQPICKENVSEKTDNAHGMTRTEINCARCDAHLGHVFDDGPQPTNLRFCLNSESLDFTEEKDLAKLAEKVK